MAEGARFGYFPGMGPNERVEVSTPHHCLLYENRRGQPVRMMARVGLIISSGVLLCLGWALWRSSGNPITATWSTPVLAGFIIIGVSAGLFALSSWRLGQRFVVQFEVWPRSHLAIVRTAGVWREQIHLVPWRDLQSTENTSFGTGGQSDPWVRVRLSSGRRLIFDHQHGSAPQGWAALARFLHKRSLPDKIADRWAPSAA
jgi:hypothetical protein